MMKRPTPLIAILCLSLILSSCATINTIKQMPEGSGVSKIYAHPYDKVFEASVNTIRNFQLEIVDISKDKGYIYAQKRGSGAQGAGEGVGIRFTQIDKNTTKVDVITRIFLMFNLSTPMDTTPYSPYNSESIFKNIEFELSKINK